MRFAKCPNSSKLLLLVFSAVRSFLKQSSQLCSTFRTIAYGLSTQFRRAMSIEFFDFIVTHAMNPLAEGLRQILVALNCRFVFRSNLIW